MWDLIFLTRDRTYVPYIGRQSLNHWATKEFPDENISIIQVFLKYLLCDLWDYQEELSPLGF